MPENNPQSNTRYTPSLIGTLLCLLTVSVLALPVSAAIGNPKETCVDQPLSAPFCATLPTLFFQCNPRAVLTAKKSKLDHPIRPRSEIFNGGAMHTNIANHVYESALSIVKKFPELRKEILNDVDINKRTPLHIALEVGAPASVILELITKENVIMPDKYGVTPFMLAARGTDPSVMDAITHAIGQNRIQKAITAKDKKGQTVREWNKVSTTLLNAQFKSIEVDGSKSKDYCSNSLLDKSEYIFLSQGNNPKIRNAYKDVGLEVGSSYAAGQPNFSIKATRANADRLLEIANGNSKDTNLARNKLAKAWGVSNDRNNKFWRYIATEVTKIQPSLSYTSLAEQYVDRQEANWDIIQTYRNGHKSYSHAAQLNEQSDGMQRDL